VQERNRIATHRLERYRLKAGYGDYESQNRDNTVSAKMLSSSVLFPSIPMIYMMKIFSLADMSTLRPLKSQWS
jgi:hypothetical protein